MAFPPPSPPKSLLGRHRLLAPSASVRVSPLSLGGMSIGDAWKMGFGECTKEDAFLLLDTFYDLGGNFIDTANAYQFGQSEEWIGEWLKKSGRRSEIVLATKYTMNSMTGHPVQQSNYGGTGTKSMHLSIGMSLKSLQTDYVDIFYVHAWDYATDISELMQSLNNLVTQGKVLYLGISDTPAYVVAKANAYARQHGLRPFSIYQGRYSAQARDLEREIIPMCRDEGMAIHAWGVLAMGQFKVPNVEDKGSRKMPPHMLLGREQQVAQVLDSVAKRHGVPLTSVAIAYAMQKTPYMYPILGGTKIEHLKANIKALSLELTADDVAEIETGYNFDLGFPQAFMNAGGYMINGPQDIAIINGMGYFDYVAPPSPIKPHKGELTAAWKTPV